MLKCKVCEQDKEEDMFPVASITKSGRAGECKACKAIRTKAIRKERGNKLYTLFDKKCRDCGIEHTNPSFYDFHHVDEENKKYEVKTMICGNWNKVLEEAEKCVMLCPNCHRKRHIGENENVF